MRVERDKAVTGPLSIRVSQLCISVTKMPMNYLVPETTLPVVSRVGSDGAEPFLSRQPRSLEHQ